MRACRHPTYAQSSFMQNSPAGFTIHMASPQKSARHIQPTQSRKLDICSALLRLPASVAGKNPTQFIPLTADKIGTRGGIQQKNLTISK